MAVRVELGAYTDSEDHLELALGVLDLNISSSFSRGSQEAKKNIDSQLNKKWCAMHYLDHVIFL